MVTPSQNEAARAAELRAEQCRRRLMALQNGESSCPDDVKHAQDALAQARERTGHARSRLREAMARYKRTQIRGRAAASAPVAGQDSPPAQSPAELLEEVRRGSLSIGQTHDRYVMLGGASSLFDVDAFLHGCGTLPPPEHLLLAYTVWELCEWPPRG